MPEEIDDRFLDKPYGLAGRVIDPIGGSLTYADERSPLRRKQLEVLACLISAKGALVTRSALIDRVWDGKELVGQTALTEIIYSLRKLLGDSGPDHALIRTIPRRGYQLNVQARPLESAVAAAFTPGSPITDKAGWCVLRLLDRTPVMEAWVGEDEDKQTQRLFRFCRNEEHLRLLRREIKLMRVLRDALADRKDIATLIDWRLDEPPYFLEMDYAAHGRLADCAERKGGLGNIAVADRIRWMGEIAGALAAVHAAGIMHRHLDAESILIDEEDGHCYAKLGNFGLGELTDRSRLEELQITHAGLTLQGDEDPGQSRYLAPERLAGLAATAASDIYALGVLLHQVVVGDLQRTPVGDLGSDQLRELIRACTAEQAADRPTAMALYEQLSVFNLASLEQPESSKQTDDRPPMSSAPNAAQRNATSSLLGQQIGPYRLLDQLGEGGMGEVYLAEQREPVKRQVALKLIKAGMDTNEVLARFDAERQALALMNHANVAAVFDAGSAPNGRPYFAMEHVPGMPITDHCDNLELGFRQRITLFLEVCDGVLHAHQRGLIHRDLKPSNILVKSPQGQSATVKIIDFGVAKSLQSKLSATTVHTRLGSFVGTPAYTSPEQIAGHRVDVDTRTDIYSLGIVLYRLLAGVTPYAKEQLAGKSPVELARVISGGGIPSLLARYASLSADDELDIATHRSVSIEQMKAVLDADLSWIVAKCLERDPEDRYASVLELKKDLRRWLDEKPIEARPTTKLYRLRKLVRRQRATVALVAGTVFALVATTSLAVYGYFRAERALGQAEIAADFQTQQIQSIDPAAMGMGLRQKLVDAIRSAGKDANWPASETDSKVLEFEATFSGVNFTDLSLTQLDDHFFNPSLSAIESRYSEYPVLQSRLLQAIGDASFSLGRYHQALSAQELAAHQRFRALGPNHRDTLYSQAQLAHTNARLDPNGGAEEELRVVVAQMRQSLGIADPLTLATMARLVGLLGEKGATAEAIALQEETLAAQQAYLPSDDVETWESINSLGGLMFDQGDLEQAGVLIRKALDARRRILGPQHSDTLNSMNDLALVLDRLDQSGESVSLMREALEGYEERAGEAHPNTIQLAANLARLLREQGHIAESEIYTRSVLANRRIALGIDNVATRRASVSLAKLLIIQGELAEAEPFLLTGMRSKSGLSDAVTRSAQFHHAVLLEERGDLGQAERKQLELSRELQQVDGNSKLALSALSHLGHIKARQDLLQEAETMQREALSRMRTHRGDTDRGTLLALNRLANVLLRRENLPDALALSEELVGSADQVLPRHLALRAEFWANRGQVLLAAGRMDQSEQAFLTAWEALIEADSVDPEQKQNVAKSLKDLYAQWTNNRSDPEVHRHHDHWQLVASNLPGGG